MQGLSQIQETVIRVAEAITAALDIETEIVDNELRIIGGTGRYVNKIGAFEEEGNLESSYIYASILRNGNEYICFDTSSDDYYNQQEGELAEITCPIRIDDKIIGLIGLVAFDKKQQEQIIKKSNQYLTFLRRMSDLIGSKLLEAQSHNRLEIMLESAIQRGYKTGFESLIGNSKEIREVIKRGLQVAPNDSTVLITGESGTGKELFARAIHSNSNRNSEAFVSINCGAIPEALLESELFGYEKGAFTGASPKGKIGKFELANKGTIFLDEIGDMPLHLQVKLLHFIKNRQIDRIGGLGAINIDVRIIAATNQNLEEMIRKGEFREDLFFRLNVIPIYLPPLRERKDDLELLLEASLDRLKQKFDKNVLGFDDEAMEILKLYKWPGNIRELENLVEYSINMATGKMIGKENLPERVREVMINKWQLSDTLKFKMDTVQKKIIEDCLEKTGKSLIGKKNAAKILGISEATLYRRIKELKIND